MINQFIFLLFLIILGTILMFFLKNHLSPLNIYLLSLPMGFAAWLFLTTVIILLFSPIIQWLICFIYIVTIVLLLVIQGNKIFSSTYWKSTLFFWNFFFIFSFLFLKFNFSILSNDSWTLTIAGKSFPSTKIFVESLFSFTGIYSIILHSSSSIFGFDYLYALFPLIALFFFLSFLYNLNLSLSSITSTSILPQLKPQQKTMSPFSNFIHKLKLNFKPYSLLSTFLVFSSFFIIFNSFYIHSNLLTGVYSFIALFGLWKRASQGNKAWLLVSWGALFTSCLLRIEGPFFALIIIILLISVNSISYQEKFCYVGLLSLLMVLWHAYLACILSGFTHKYVLTSHRALLIMALYIAAFILLILSQKISLRRLKKYFPLAMVYSLTLGWSFIIFTRGLIEKGNMLILERYGILTLNVLKNGGWGILWVILTVLFIICLLLKRFPYESLFTYYILSFFLIFNILNLYRGGWREGWGDSGNRMLIQGIFIVAFYTFYKSGRLLLSNLQK